ncbi:Phospholipase A2 [Amphibalanus amphitrite]|uniref:Phospholipase A2 n=1 Tax=Amphibalanus amphitrite TaxID=1232801 RepID=A0A6A4W1D2_AMPAM|nr:Phospholipase A2 [Amphibalanus amphitrite]
MLGYARVHDTKWCGAGTSATSYDDLGSARATDLCCRQHDHCPVSLEAGEARGGVTNTGHFTRSDCECDAAFFHCLVKAATVHSQLVGELYFNLLEPDCIESSTTRSERREETREEQNQAKDQEPSEDQDQDQTRDRSPQRAVRLRFVRQPLAGQFPEPPNEEAMADRAEALAARALGVFTAGR